MGSVALAVYIAFGLVIGWSAVRHRREGWKSGVLFSLLWLSIPLWVAALLWLYTSL